MDNINYTSDPLQITAAINRALSVETELEFDLLGSNNLTDGVDLIGKLGGRDVRIEVRHKPGDKQYSESVWVVDKKTGEKLGRGNGDRTLDLAIQIYHWRSIPGAIKELS